MFYVLSCLGYLGVCDIFLRAAAGAVACACAFAAVAARFAATAVADSWDSPIHPCHRTGATAVHHSGRIEGAGCAADVRAARRIRALLRPSISCVDLLIEGTQRPQE